MQNVLQRLLFKEGRHGLMAKVGWVKGRGWRRRCCCHEIRDDATLMSRGEKGGGSVLSGHAEHNGIQTQKRDKVCEVGTEGARKAKQ